MRIIISAISNFDPTNVEPFLPRGAGWFVHSIIRNKKYHHCHFYHIFFIKTQLYKQVIIIFTR